MLNSHSARPKWITSFLLVALLLSACQQQLPFKLTQKVSDPGSPLLGALMNRAEVPGNWVWYREELYQSYEASTYPGYDLVDAAARSVTGDYGGQRYYTQITHRLEHYEPGSPPLELLKRGIEEAVLGEEKTNTYATYTFSPTLVSVGTGVVSKCVSPDLSRDPVATGVKICFVSARYNHVVSKLIFYVAPGSMGDDSVAVILNQILTTTDGRIKEIDK